MFTGIITEIGTIKSVQDISGNLLLHIDALNSASELHIGDSVSVNGACLTVTKVTKIGFFAEAVQETRIKTTLNSIRSNIHVNLELSLKFSDRLGGHLVQGHVDTIGNIRNIQKKEGSWLFTIEIPGSYLLYCIPKGSIAIDGVSLTIADIKHDSVVISIIPHSYTHTILGKKKKGDKVNIEVDVIGKYVNRFLEKKSSEKLTIERLHDLGF